MKTLLRFESRGDNDHRGRQGKRCRNNADRKGCADGQTPAQETAPPFSSRRCRACTAGVCATAAKRPFASAPTESLAKRGQSRTTTDTASRGSGEMSKSEGRTKPGCRFTGTCSVHADWSFQTCWGTDSSQGFDPKYTCFY